MTASVVPDDSQETLAARAIEVSKIYGKGQTEVRALDNLSVDIPSGRYTAIMGPSGSGKSTLMHCLAGLDRITSGRIFIGDVELNTLSEKQLTLLRRDKVGFVFQAYNLLPTLTAAENVELPLAIAGRKPDRGWVDTVIDAVGLRERLGHKPAELSGGQQQRVAAARALASKPAIVFADEPTGNLDSASGTELLGFMRRSVDEYGQTIVMVTHDPNAASFADHVLFLADGRIVDEMANPTAEKVLDLMKKLGAERVMGKATLKGLLAHKFRLAATALAIVLGVSFVAGTYVLTDTITASFDNLFKQVTQGIDVAVRSEETFGGFEGEVRDPMPASLLERIKAVDGVRVAEGNVTGYAQLVGKDGKAVTTGGAPSLGVSFNQDTAFTAGSTMRAGRLPSGPTEAAIDAKTAEDTGFQPGDQVKVLFQGPARTFTVSGIIGFGEADNLGGARLVGFDLATAQEVLNRQGRFDEIDVAAVEGVTPEQLRDRIRAGVDPRYEVLTGTELAEDTAAAINDTIGRFLSTALLAFAFVALLVGAFLIFNTFTIIVAQRTRELALLRCLGASRRQVMNSVLLESVIVALVASLVGLGLGVLIANGLKALLSGFLGADIPTTGVVFQLRTVVVSLLVGLIVTVLAALMPALKATRVPPVAALQPETAFAPTGFRRRRIVLGLLVTAVGVALLLAGLYRSEGNELVNIGAGAVVVFLGVAVLSPLIARPLAKVIGWPFARAFRLPGDLARQNAMRNPRRTASTAAALMIGLALVAFVSILAASIKASTTEILEDTVAADYILMNDNFQPFSPEAAERLAEQPELAAVAGMRFAPWKLDGVGKGLQGIDPAAFQQVVRTEVTSGSLDDLASGGLAVRDEVAQANGWTVGTRVPMEFPRAGVEQVPVKAIYKDNSLNGDFLLGLATYEHAYADQADSQILIKAAPGVAAADSRAAVDRVMADFPNVTVRDQAEFRDEQARQIDQIINLFYSLLGLAILIALFGIVNTLGLSIFERIRELGLLRAVGATRAQLRSMIRWEAVIIAVLGAVLGLAVGMFFGWTMVQALTSEGITEFVVPGGQLAGFVLAAGVAGILAAILPGRRAAKIDMLRAITTE